MLLELRTKAFILVDTENVGFLDDPNLEDCELYYFCNTRMTKPKNLRGTVIEVATGKKDSLDFQLDVYLGMLMQKHGASCVYCIISKDRGFDYVVNFAKSQGYKVIRYDTMPALIRGNKTELTDDSLYNACLLYGNLIRDEELKSLDLSALITRHMNLKYNQASTSDLKDTPEDRFIRRVGLFCPFQLPDLDYSSLSYNQILKTLYKTVYASNMEQLLDVVDYAKEWGTPKLFRDSWCSSKHKLSQSLLLRIDWALDIDSLCSTVSKLKNKTLGVSTNEERNQLLKYFKE